MKEKTCCFTGHRKIPPEQYNIIARYVEKEIIKSIENGYLYFGTGGALGFDTLAAQTVLMLKKYYPQIKLILVLPCRNQAKCWQKEDICEYERIKNLSDKIVYTSERYYNGCMFKRNRHLIDNSSLCICYLTKLNGGTAYTVDYALKTGVQIVNIAKL